MKTNISPRDFELLSEYLDQQLPQGKRAQLEARLKTNPDLRAALEDLRRTRAALRSLPPVRAPRNFTLTPQMVGVKPPRRLFPAFQFASALASLLLILVLAGDFLGNRLAASAPAVSFSSATQAETINPETPRLSVQAANTAPAAAPTQSSPSLGAAPAATVAPPAISAAIQPTPTPGGSPSTASGENTAGGSDLTQEPAATLLPPAAPLPDQSLIQNSNPITNGKTVSSEASIPTPEETISLSSHPQQQPIGPALPIIRLAEVILALIAIGSGLAAFLLRRTSM